MAGARGPAATPVPGGAVRGRAGAGRRRRRQWERAGGAGSGGGASRRTKRERERAEGRRASGRGDTRPCGAGGAGEAGGAPWPAGRGEAGAGMAGVSYSPPWWVSLLHRLPHLSLRWELTAADFRPHDAEYQQVGPPGAAGVCGMRAPGRAGQRERGLGPPGGRRRRRRKGRAAPAGAPRVGVRVCRVPLAPWPPHDGQVSPQRRGRRGAECRWQGLGGRSPPPVVWAATPSCPQPARSPSCTWEKVKL